jgi:AcrR family transcriptional regulator
MDRRVITENEQAGVRQGTATRRSGRRTAGRLLQAAQELLEQDNFERFSLRAVADRAGVSLANLQYYYPKREDLARALCSEVGNRYRQSYDECLAASPADPLPRLVAVLRFNLADIRQRKTRRFFIQLWALLGSIDDFEGAYLRELYRIDVDQLTEHLAPVAGTDEPAELRRRATLIAALIEGLLLVQDCEPDETASAVLIEQALETALRIAHGD